MAIEELIHKPINSTTVKCALFRNNRTINIAHIVYLLKCDHIDIVSSE